MLARQDVAIGNALASWKRRLMHVGAAASALIMEPLVQGAGGMSMHPEGYLSRAANICREHGAWLMLDEVLTGFGRAGEMFAFQKEQVVPDVVALAKGLSGGYLPLAATVASDEIFDAFLGDFAEMKTFFHGHSYSGNALGCAAALANLEILKQEDTMRRVREISASLGAAASRFWEHPNVGDVRVEGVICAIEIVKDFATREAFPFTQRMGVPDLRSREEPRLAYQASRGCPCADARLLRDAEAD